MDKFTKGELTTGMVIKVNTGEKYLVLKGSFVLWDNVVERLVFINEDGFDGGSSLSEDLQFGSGRCVTEVYAPPICGLTDTLKQCNKYNLLWERSEVDWSKIPVDTKVLVRNENDYEWEKRHFAKYENGLVYTFDFGRTSWSGNGETTKWNYAKLA